MMKTFGLKGFGVWNSGLRGLVCALAIWTFRVELIAGSFVWLLDFRHAVWHRESLSVNILPK